MEKIAENHPSVGNVRGKGFFWAIEFVSDQEAKTPMGGEAMGAFGAELKKAGICRWFRATACTSPRR